MLNNIIKMQSAKVENSIGAITWSLQQNGRTIFGLGEGKLKTS